MYEDGNSRMLPPEGGDVPSPSKHRTSVKRIIILGPRKSRQLGVRETSLLSPSESQLDLAMYEDGNSRMLPPEGGDVPYPPKHGTSRKRIKMHGAVGFGYGPRVPLCMYFDGLCFKEDFAGCVGIALSSFNDTNRAQQGPLYELVEVLEGILTPILLIHHFNFIARPKNGSEGENKLFFAEVKNGPYDGGNGRHCTFCCILGAPGSVTDGFGDCRLYCHNHPGRVHHPQGGGFTQKISFN